MQDNLLTKNTQGYVRFGSALKWSFHGTGCSRSDVQPTAGQSQGKPRGSRLKEQEERYTAFSAPHSPKFYRYKVDRVDLQISFSE